MCRQSLAAIVKSIYNRDGLVGRCVGKIIFANDSVHPLFVPLRRCDFLFYTKLAYLSKNQVRNISTRGIYKRIFRYFITTVQLLYNSEVDATFYKIRHCGAAYMEFRGYAGYISAGGVGIVQADCL